MERKPKSDSYRKAALTAQSIIKSRTGNAIMKQAYRTTDKQVEKKVRLIDNRKGKELRKLAYDKVQFINEQDEKLKRKDLLKTRAPKHNEATQAVVVEIRIPSEKDFAAENKNCDDIPEEAKSPRTARSSLTREKQNARKLKDICSAAEANNLSNGIFTEQIEDYEFTENGEIVLPVKTIREFNEEAKRGRLPDNEIEVRTTNFYEDYNQVATWLSAVERENLGHFQRPQKSSRRKGKTPHDGAPTNDKENSEQNTCKSSKDKVDDKRGFLKLPQINDKLNSPISSRKSLNRMDLDSLEDPHFTNLLDTLTPVKGTLKLPKIPRSIESKSRAS